MPSGTAGNSRITLPPAVGDEANLRQVFTNLIGKALKHSSKTERPEAASAQGATFYFTLGRS